MGDVALSALVSEVVGRLTSEVIKELALLWGFKDDISTLKNDFDTIEAVLQDAEEKHQKENAVGLWLKRLRSASLEVENMLDEISTAAMLQRLFKEKGIKYMVRAFFSSSHNRLLFRIRIAHKVKAIRRKLDAIASKKCELSLTPGVVSHVDVRNVGEMPDRETSSLIDDSLLIFGRSKETEMVTKNICNEDVGKYDNGEIRVYAIWGMGGVGKTTLAQLVYNHERVNKSFEFKCWVYVSENFQVKEIIKKIIESIDKCECKLTQLETLQESFRNKLKGKKFLIVLDDVWIEDNEKTKWDQLSKTLSCGAEGSIVVMTTRSQATSQMMAKVPELQHKLGCLSEEDSWLLFKKFAFAHGRERGQISELEPIGREIVEKCKGLPLALKTLGSLMWSKRSTSDWQHVKDSNIWELQETEVLPALKLSYDNLLPHLKRCFAYCCLFPKGHNMEKEILIPLWVSNGFIQHTEEMDLHGLGEEIFNCLVWRSFFQVVEKDRYNMHDLMHDMARHVMRHDCLALEYGKKVIIPNELLHLSLQQPNFLFSPQDLEKLKSLRSILMLEDINEFQISQIFKHVYLRVLYLPGYELRTLPPIFKLRHLRYLNFSKSRMRVLPKSIMYLQNLQVLVLSSCYFLYKLHDAISYLKHLNYLNLSESGIKALPESFIYLQNLQVLILRSCKNLHKLPEGLRYMVNLQRVDISSCVSLLHLPPGIKELTRLRILTWFPIGNESGAKIGELGDLNLLEGKLEISPLENVEGLNEAKSANLKYKRNLSVLELKWSGFEESKREMLGYDEKVLEGLEPNPCLKELSIYNYTGKIISPSWMANLRNLIEIRFYWCKNCEHVPPLWRLPNLRVIKLEHMTSLKCFHDDNKNMLRDTMNAFLCLQELHISHCRNLVSLPSNLPKLEVLKISWCGKLVSLPSNLPNIRKLHLLDCDSLVSLPDGIESFKDLNELDITGSLHLIKRCEKEIGVDWPKISHIPKITVDLRWVRLGRRLSDEST